MKTLLLTVVMLGAIPQATGFKIVVISGEDAINVIQQRTAVAPLLKYAIATTCRSPECPSPSRSAARARRSAAA